jgi:hypothetical protein
MKRGVWHQFGDRSQNLIQEQLQHGNGVGVILSPRDLSLANATTRSEEYRALGADLLLDTQFYEPSYQNRHLASFELEPFRQSVSDLCKLGDHDLDQLAHRLERLNRDLETSAVLAPALVYEAGRVDIIDLNSRLFSAAKAAAESIGIPVYATIVLGKGVTNSDTVAYELLSHATSLQAAGCYYAVELDDGPTPTDAELVYRLCSLGLTLACSGLPILHGYAGLTGLLAFAFGADAVAFGHSHNLRYFTRERWQERPPQGGAGEPPPRYLSGALWSTIVLPDETVRLRDLWSRVASPSPFAPASAADTNWSRWQANKHLLFVLGNELTRFSIIGSARTSALAAVDHLRRSAELHRSIGNLGIDVKDNANRYQANWFRALTDILQERQADFDYLHLLGK